MISGKENEDIHNVLPFFPFPDVLPQSNVGTTVLPVSFVHKHAQLGKCKLQAYYLDRPCCARPSGPVANRWTVQQQGTGRG